MSPEPTQTPTQTKTQTPTNTATKTQTPSITRTKTPTPSQGLGPQLQDCVVLYVSGSQVYGYNPSNNQTTQLNVPNTSLSNDIAHTSNKLWLSRTDSLNILEEWNISLSPFIAVYNRQITLPHPIGFGLYAVNNTTLIATNPTTTPNQIVELNISDNNSVSTFKFNLTQGRIVTGDFILTTDNKFIVTTTDGITQYVEQYNYLTTDKELEFVVNIDSPDGLFVNNGQIYLVNGTSTGIIYNVQLTPPFNTSSTVALGRDTKGTSQLGSCLNASFSPIQISPSPTRTPSPTPTILPQPFTPFIECCDPYRIFSIYNIPQNVLTSLVSDTTYYIEAVGFSGCATYSPFITTVNYYYDYISIQSP